MKRISLLLCITLSLGLAEDIDTLIQKAYDNSFALKAMQKEVQINFESTKTADSWDNPMLSAGVTDVMLDDISNRSLEPMQTQFIALSQTIPLGGKKGITKTISNDFMMLSKLQIEDTKAIIASKITHFAYQSIIIDERLKLIEEKRNNLKTIQKLQQAYQQSEENYLGVGVSLLQLENKQERLHYEKEAIKKQIEKFTVTPVSTIEDSLAINALSHVNIEKHPKIELLKQKTTLEKSKSSLARAKKIPDLKVSGGYFQRDARNDYINLSFSLPLLVNGKEDIEVVKAKLSVLKSEEALKEVQNNFKTEIELLLKSTDASAKNYNRYLNQLIPKQKKITKFIQRKNRIGKANLIQVTKSKNLTIALKEQSLDALQRYFKAYSKLRYYQ